MTTTAGTRPAEFDAKVMSHLTALQRLAARLKPYAHREDLVTDTIMYALAKWENFRADGDMWNWLAYGMRGIASNEAKTASALKRQASLVSIDDHTNLSTPPNQFDSACLGQIARRLRKTREGRALYRYALGDRLHEIAAVRKISTERARQLVVAGRAKLMRKAG